MSSIIKKQLKILETNKLCFKRTKLEYPLEPLNPEGLLKRKVVEQIDALNKIGELGTPYDAVNIIKYVFSDNVLVSNKASITIRRLLTKSEVSTA